MLDTMLVQVEVPDGTNVIIGQSHFIKTTEDIHEVLVSSVPGIQFGLAFCESSGPRLVRIEGNSEELKKLATKNALEIGAGHSFIIYIKGAFPINVLNALKNLGEVCQIFCATANPVQAIVAQSEQGRGILGIIDGGSPLGVETEQDIKERRAFLRKIGYKL
jgi:adenosine/AMP kinase